MLPTLLYGTGEDVANALVSGDSTLWDGGGERRLASAIAGCVWVAGLSGHCSARLILDGTSHASTLAARARGGGAVDELLLGDADQIASSNLPSSLSAAGGGERPARATLALVLYRSDSAGGDPIHRCGQFLTIVLMHTEMWQAIHRLRS